VIPPPNWSQLESLEEQGRNPKSRPARDLEIGARPAKHAMASWNPPGNHSL